MTLGLSLALLALGTAKAAGSDGLLAVFTAGLAFRHTTAEDLALREERMQEAVTRFFILPVFVVFGMLAPWREWTELGWRGVGLVVAVLLLRRLPALLMTGRWIPVFTARADAWLLGWFGPVGIAALYYACLALRHTGQRQVWAAATEILFASLCLHTVTATPFTRWFGGAMERRKV